MNLEKGILVNSEILSFSTQKKKNNNFGARQSLAIKSGFIKRIQIEKNYGQIYNTLVTVECYSNWQI